MTEKYDPTDDWSLEGRKWIGLNGGEYQFRFETYFTVVGSRLMRDVIADTEEEAWEKLTPPKK